jgi:signal transduction histidine kinase
VVVNVVAETEGVRVEVIDDGHGFTVSPGARAPGHRGLANMVDRASVSGGWCRIESDQNGTTVRFWMPYDDPTGRTPEAAVTPPAAEGSHR